MSRIIKKVTSETIHNATTYTTHKCRCEICVQARKEYFDAWRAKNPESRIKDAAKKKSKYDTKKESISRRKRIYDLDDSSYQEMLTSQNNSCAICNKQFIDSLPQIDHCHKTGKIRGILCLLCNTGIGKLQDDPTLLLKAVDYLEKGRVA